MHAEPAHEAAQFGFDVADRAHNRGHVLSSEELYQLFLAEPLRGSSAHPATNRWIRRGRPAASRSRGTAIIIRIRENLEGTYALQPIMPNAMMFVRPGIMLRRRGLRGRSAHPLDPVR